MYKHLLYWLSIITLLSACSGDTSDQSELPTDDTGTNPIVVDPISSGDTPLVTNRYSLKSGYELEQVLKLSIENYSSANAYAYDMAVVNATAAPAAESAGDTGGDSASGFSTTNIQEQGVAESDRVKYDGQTMYVVEEGNWSDESGIRVLQRGPDNQLTEINHLSLGNSFMSEQNIYLDSEIGRLASVGRGNNVYFTMADVVPGYAHIPYQVQLFDVTLPASASQLTSYQFDGSLVDSRRIDDQLYLVGVYSSNLPQWDYAATTEAEIASNKVLLDSTELTELLPSYRRDNGDAVPLVSQQECYVPTDETADMTQIVTIIKLDMNAPDNMEVLCFIGHATDIYMSQESVYLIDDNYSSTHLDKFSLRPQLSYQASAHLKGDLGWNNPAFRLSEYQEELRIVHTVRDDTLTHYLSVLVQDGVDLKVRAQLPNSQQPDAIGKPGEDVYAVRYFGERAYIVTFEQTDPLYVIDVPVADEPVILGSLEIPGFSDYLHPLDNNYLLGVGQEVEVITEPSGWQRVNTTGMKVSLFDINDPTNPIEATNLTIANGYTPVSYDHRALSVLKLAGTYRFALPLQQWNQCTAEVCTAEYSPADSMVMLEVDTQVSGGNMTQLRQWFIDQEGDRYINAWRNRAIIHKAENIDLIYYLRGNEVFSTPWAIEGNTAGPY